MSSQKRRERRELETNRPGFGARAGAGGRRLRQRQQEELEQRLDNAAAVGAEDRRDIHEADAARESWHHGHGYRAPDEFHARPEGSRQAAAAWEGPPALLDGRREVRLPEVLRRERSAR